MILNDHLAYIVPMLDSESNVMVGLRRISTL